MSIKQEIEEEVMENISTQPEKRIANHLAVRAIWVSPLFLVISAIGWGLGGAISALLALVLVAFNFLTGAAIITRTVKISPNLLYGSVLGGYVVRLAISISLPFVSVVSSNASRAPLIPSQSSFSAQLIYLII